ncbi:MAG: hypothetical protein M3P47_00130 [Pseudomonadota bacterium]|nr:hypothetical protein [Pseudomonadota bacterium]
MAAGLGVAPATKKKLKRKNAAESVTGHPMGAWNNNLCRILRKLALKGTWIG